MHNRKAVTKVLYHAFVILFGFMMVYPVLWMPTIWQGCITMPILII